MTRNLRAVLFGILAGVAALGAAVVACSSSAGPPACNALAACCESPSFAGDPSSCIETAQSGELADATCGQSLTMYQQSGQCPFDAGGDAGGGSTSTVVGDAARD